jgi:polygalacturonase
MDSQLVAPPRFVARAANVVLFGADPTGRRDSAGAFDRAIAFAQRTHVPVYIPPGRFHITNVHFKDIKVDGTGTSVVSARTAGSASFENGDQ